MSSIEKIVCSVVFGLVVIGLVISWSAGEEAGNHWFFREDGLIETLTLVPLIASSALCLRRAYHFWGSGPGLRVVATLAMAGIFLFGAMEEISWGQRLFDAESSDFFVQNNRQRETNLHNMQIYGWSLNRIVFSQALALAVALYLFAVPVAYQRNPSVRRWIGQIGLPVPRFRHALMISAIFLLVATASTGKRDELSEFGSVAIFFAVFYDPKNADSFDMGQKEDSV